MDRYGSMARLEQVFRRSIRSGPWWSEPIALQEFAIYVSKTITRELEEKLSLNFFPDLMEFVVARKA